VGRDLADFFQGESRTEAPQQYLAPKLKGAEVQGLVGLYQGGLADEVAERVGLSAKRLQRLWVSDRQRDGRRRS
jgi:hypothetical protein